MARGNTLERMKGRSLVSINDLTKEEIIALLDLAEEFALNPRRPVLENLVVATLFFERERGESAGGTGDRVLRGLQLERL